MGRAKFPIYMMEPLEDRRLLSADAASVAPLVATTTMPPPAQQSYQNPFIQLYLDGKRLPNNYVLNFGAVAEDSTPITKTVTLIYAQGNPKNVNTAPDGPVLNITTNQPNDLAALESGKVVGPGADIVAQFRNNGVRLPINAKVTTEAGGAGFLITFGNKYYLIDNVIATDTLTVNHYRFVIDPFSTGAKTKVASIPALIDALDTLDLFPKVLAAFKAYGNPLPEAATLSRVSSGNIPLYQWGIVTKKGDYLIILDASGVLVVGYQGKNSPSGEFPALGAARPTPQFDATVTGTAPDEVQKTLTITFTPTTPGEAVETIALPVYDGSGTVVALNVKADVLPTAGVSVTRIVMGRLPKIAGNSFRVGGTPPEGVARVQLTNNSTYVESGETNVTLYASSTDTLDTSDALLLGTTNSDARIKAGKNKFLTVHFDFPVPPASGDFHIFAVASGPALIAASGAVYQSPILQPIVAPQINLQGIATQSPSFLTHSTTRITVPIENTGNEHAKADVQLNIYTLPPQDEPGASTSPSLVGSYDLSYSIDPIRKAIHSIQLGTMVQAGWEIIAEITAIHLSGPFSYTDISTLPDSFAVR